MRRLLLALILVVLAAGAARAQVPPESAPGAPEPGEEPKITAPIEKEERISVLPISSVMESRRLLNTSISIGSLRRDKAGVTNGIRGVLMLRPPR